ncbi:MAG: hypothetical protein NUV96_02420 [Candidatus Colwellbacteria bacterium]|nr:hypothetical protein [Candidatus Colwellbacteria bacterium]
MTCIIIDGSDGLIDPRLEAQSSKRPGGFGDVGNEQTGGHPSGKLVVTPQDAARDLLQQFREDVEDTLRDIEDKALRQVPGGSSPGNAGGAFLLKQMGYLFEMIHPGSKLKDLTFAREMHHALREGMH